MSAVHSLAGRVVLVVEDEPEIAETLEAYLKREGFKSERALDGEVALRLFRQVRPDLVLLDVLLPKVDGLEVLRTIRSESSVPVILLTAKAEEIDRVLGLGLGADDYVVKPYSFREVVARVRAVLRRASGAFLEPETVLATGSLRVALAEHRATVRSELLALTPTEFCLLALLAEHPGRVYSREALLEAALPEGDALLRTIDSHMRNLRAKLKSLDAAELLETVRGVGYRLRSEA